MLKTILSISGKPGLFKMISQGKNMIVVESLLNGKRTPAYANEKIIALSDIAIFTVEGEKPLIEVFQLIKDKEQAAQASVDLKATADTLRNYFAEIMPDFDRERVYPSDIKKLLGWYNLLIDKGLSDFETVNEESTEVSSEESTEA